MSSRRPLKFGVASAVLAWSAVLAGCGGHNAAAVGTSPPTASTPPSPPPVASASPPPAASAPPSASTPAPAPLSPGGAELAEGDEHRARHHGGVVMLVAMSLKDLDLSADQKATVEKIRADLLAKMEPARAAGKVLANTIADGVAAGSVDRAKVDAAIEKVAAQVQALHGATLDSMNRLHATLNAQQRAALVDKLQGHWEMWKDAHGKDELDDTQHRSGHLLALVKRLGLTKEQAEKIKATFHDQMKTKPQDHEHKEVRDHMQAFGTAFKSDKFDAKTLTTASAANGHMARWGATRMARFAEAAAPVLTPDQRTKLSQMIRDDANRAEQ